MGKTLKALIIEDSEDDVLLLTRHLKQRGFNPVTRRVETADALHSALTALQWDVILCDMIMPRLNALGALEVVRSVGADVPFIVVSGTVGEEQLVELMKAGAHDIIVKDRLARLVPAIEREMSDAAVRRKHRQIEHQLQVAIDSISEGFTLYDSQDRLVICNDTYRRMYNKATDLIVPGATFEEIIRGGADRGQYEQALGRVEEFVRERMALHRVCGEPFEQELNDGRWVLIDERRTGDGGTVGIRTDITALKTAQRDLRENEAFLRLIADNLPILVAYLDLEQRYRLINKTGASWYGHSELELIGKSVAEILGPASYKALEPHLDRAAKGISEIFETTITYPDGVTRDIYAVYVPDRDDKGVVNGFVAMAIDITDRKRSEAALRESERRFKDVSSAATDWIWEMDEALRFSYLSDRFQEVTGVAPKHILGRTRYEVAVTDENEEMWESYLADLNARRPFRSFRYIHVDPAGGRRYWSISGVPIFDSDGCFHGYRGTGTDLTKQVQAEQSLHEAERRDQVILQTLTDGVAMISADGIIRTFNLAAERMFGYTAAEVVGQKVNVLMAEPYSGQHDSYIARYLSSGQRTVIGNGMREVLARRKDGSSFPAEIAVQETEIGGSRFFAGVVRDLTRRKEEEEDKARLEARLRQGEKMEALGQLTGGIAHDFNNLLTVILGNARLLERGLKGDERLAARADAISNTAKRGASLVARLSAFGRKDNLEPKVIDGRKLVSDMLDMLRRTLGEAFEIETQFADEQLTMLADPAQLEAALLNLAANARDAMANSGTLTIAMENVRIREKSSHPGPQVAPGDYVMLSVADTGSGIPAEQLGRIFEPFFTTKEVGKGTGLGLSMVFGFVQHSGGEIRVESEIGCGTTFRLYLPKGADAGTGGAESQNLDRVAANGQGTILVVEDEPAVRDIAVAMLEGLGFRIVEAENGPNALAKLDQHRDIDLLFTDVVMPGGMTGFDLAERARERNPGLKVLFTTGYADGAAEQNGGVPDGATFVAKPYEEAELAEKIRESLGTQR